MIAIIDYDAYHNPKSLVNKGFFDYYYLPKISFTNYLLIKMS